MNKKIMQAIDRERKEQDKKWGGAVGDDTNSVLDWVAIIAVHASKAIKQGEGKEGWYPPWPIFRQQMVRVAALAIAAIEYADRKAKFTTVEPRRS